MDRLLHDLPELTRMEETPNTPVHVNPIAVLEQLAAEQKLALDTAGITLVHPSEARSSSATGRASTSSSRIRR